MLDLRLIAFLTTIITSLKIVNSINASIIVEIFDKI